MQGEEPSTSLVDTLGNKVGREELIEAVGILERIVTLCVRHSTRIEPNIDQIALATHWLALRRYEHDAVYIWFMQVDALGRVVLGRHIAHLKVLVRILGHKASLD